MTKSYRWVVPLMTAALCVVAPWSVPVGTVGVSAATLGIYIIAGLLPPRQAALSVGLYMALGALGVPVFAAFTGGAHRLVGPTGGFLWGYILCAWVAGWLMHRVRRRWMIPVALLAGTAVLYAVGTLWYWWQAGGSFAAALAVCVLPFLIGDAVKIVAATVLIPILKQKTPSR